MALACIPALTLSVAAGRAQVAGTVEAGLAQLAGDIAEKSKAADRNTIAVLPFPHAGGGCSVLSTYIVDELILSLFSLAGSQLEIIERSQLEALLVELQIGEGGLLNPATTKELGNLSGVSALAIGTITVIGDSVRLNARLVATDTGRTVSAAAVTVPKTSALNSLLVQPSDCRIFSGGSADIGPGAPQSAGGSPTPQSSEFPNQSRDGFQVEVRKARRWGSGSVTLVIRLANQAVSSKQVSLFFLSYTDESGTVCDALYDRYTKISGIQRNEGDDPQYSTIRGGETIQFSVTNMDCEGGSFASSGSGAATVGLAVHDQTGGTVTLRFEIFDVPFES